MIENIFPTPLYRKKLAASTLTAIQQFIKNSNLTPTANRGNSTKGGFQSDEKFLSQTAPEIDLLKKEINTCLLEYLPTFHMGQTRSSAEGKNLAFDLWGWVTKFGAGGFNAPHIHPRSTISGVFYVETPDQILKNADGDFAGWLGFLDPRANSQGWPLPGHLNYSFVPPEPGFMVLFPSYLAHFVPPFPGDGDRISIAFNLRHKVKNL